MGLATNSTKQKSRLVNSKIYKKNLNLNTERKNNKNFNFKNDKEHKREMERS